MEQQHNVSLLWQDCLTYFQDKISDETIRIYLRALQVSLENNVLILYAANQFTINLLQGNYLYEIEETVRHFSGNNELTVQFKLGLKPQVTQPSVNSTVSTEQLAATQPKTKYHSNLLPQYVFENFVKGNSNKLALDIAQQAASKPGDKNSNPLVIYGSSGLGKTHLLHAIGNELVRNNPHARVVYVYAEDFVNKYITSLRSGKIEEFKRFYRSADALLIDDIQFFGRSEGTQEEFFHTFNRLFENGRQIVLASDRYPKEIEKLEERLKSRLGWGLNISIKSPNLETRVAILMKKAEEHNFHLPEDVAFFIGKRLKTNVRELEGALNNVIAYGNLTGKEVTIDFVRDVLKDMLASQDKLVTIENIQKTVAEYYKIRVSDLKSKSRARSITRPRQIAMALAKELTNRSLPEIGKEFGDRDHTTVLHACRTIESLCKENNQIQEDFSNLIRTLSP
ncbi:chromosomal replication initiation protein DnaA [Mergibacter septicus]|uniref:Chromosomal replication initiator protein DnaA n=1 Tax=Mergibacter septicus TaxID=221402 RepID=A0A8D4LLJ7_9PAST|nr:chromosomal replication initiator protein DnaA [Mergibacter septicus]AWX14677.1 chromosomal replication initiation protein DnaA [Mergibacter septicus]QDJ13928.1 chromosomal replication initiation protein DnaA [Mergibacter septicus]UTU48622.1 chromosomal replication initiator protein DnaA [Mergibacter septicus]WMR95747.1 chromosomal replication initiator protein DnaA [Mergibacter septicus]